MDTNICITGTNLMENIEETNYAVRENIHLDSLNYQTATGYGFIYQVYDTLANPLGWWPQDTSNYSNFKFEYSILTRDTTVEDLTQIFKSSWTNQISIYPNPSTNFINVNSNVKIATLEIYDCYGKSIHQQKSINQKEILKVDVQFLNKGVYYIKLIDEHSNVSFSKFIKL